MEDKSGSFVQIDIEKLINRGCSTKFKEFLEANVNRVFTTTLEVRYKAKLMYALEEDTSIPKWLFYIDDLIFIDEQGD